MEAPFLTQWLSGPIAKAICWTLIHSLWLGVIVALLAGLIIIGTQKSSSRLRYQLLCGSLLLFVLLSGFVLYRELTNYRSMQPVISSTSASTALINSVTTSPNDIIVENTNLVNGLIAFINRESVWILAVWFLFFVLKSLNVIGGLFYIHRIRTHKVYGPAEEWQNKVLAFSQRLGIRQSITLLQSQLVKVPVTVGLLKPVIVLPMGLLVQLPPEQIETILWHELAHVWRRDYFMNLLQSLVETVFFFNPALLWISALIREEREICCDDIVLSQTTSKSNYLEALLAFQGYDNPSAEFAMPLGFRSQLLVDRLRRIVTQENKRLNVVEKIALVAGLLLVMTSFLIPELKPERRPTTIAIKKNRLAVANDRPEVNPIHEQVGLREALSHQLSRSRPVARPAIARVSTELPKDTTIQFTSILFVNNNRDMMNREMDVRDETGNRYHLKIADNKLKSLAINGVVVPESNLNQYQNLLRQIDAVLAEKRQQKQEAIAGVNLKRETERQQQLQRLKESQLNKANHQQAFNKTGNPEKKWADPVSKQKRLPAETDKIGKEPGDKKRYIAQADSVAKQQSWPKKRRPSPPDISRDQERVRGIIATLVEEKVVTDPASVDWFGLSEEELIVNGKKQPDELHQRLKAHYDIKPRYGLYYGPVQMTGTGIFLDKGDL
ncbi:M48 family metalloprotease [Spirosoma aureum]|uniref:M48 family metalloprotease n=1 Tax=Spirosoma aureum TaxID=2692134 RepID=A0A6G9ALJ2_9BACT|nr:M56 family metallopeptidase [Spirosoma aureum]QIP13352.1 M48 family metalloprotease [Spirosoma aureum]